MSRRRGRRGRNTSRWVRFLDCSSVVCSFNVVSYLAEFS